ncbi:MAG: TIGR01212 family radical SAM protein [Desulfobacterales bacterium]
MKIRFYDLNTYYRGLFGCRVQKISLDAGFTCPNRDGTLSTGGCIYCNERGSGTGNYQKGMSVSEQLKQGMDAMKRRYKAEKFIAYFQAFSNTYGPVHRLERLYREALSFREVVGLSIGTRPDCINPAVLELLEKCASESLVWIEYGLQSANDRTLSLINRGHNLACFVDAVEATRNRGMYICAHVILGLPGESRRDMMKTADVLRELKVDGVKLHLCYVVCNTVLEKMYREGAYRCLEQEEYAELVVDFLERLPEEMVIHRIASDPHPDELVAPKWSLEKNTIRFLISEIMENRDTRQGKKALFCGGRKKRLP